MLRLKTVAAIVGCLVLLAVAGCGSSAQACGVRDYGTAGTTGFATPRQALNSVLVTHPKWLSEHGWVVAHRGAHAVEYRSGSDRVDVVRTSSGVWAVGAVRACT